MRLEKSIVVERDPDAVFALIDDPSRYPEFLVGITRWVPRSEKRRGLGARYRVLMQVGAIQAGGTVRVTEWEEPNEIAWVSELGVRQSGRWDVRPVARGTRLTLEIEFDLSGGPVGRLVERIAGRVVSRNMWATLLAARRILEAEGS